MKIIFFWIIVLGLILIIRKRRYRKATIRRCKSDEEPTIICVFPDFDRDNPYIAELGDKLRFNVRGYTDRKRMQEVYLDEHDIEWQHQNYIGQFTGYETDIVTGINFVNYEIPTDGVHGKLIYITARYHGLQDTTWIQVEAK